MPPGFIPQSELDPVAYANLVIDRTYVVPDDVCTDSEFSTDFAVFQSLRNELDDLLLPPADLSCSV
jgi:hypothetical protein